MSDVRTINHHLKKVFADSELEADSVIRNFRITESDGTVQDRLFERDFDRMIKQIESDNPLDIDDE